MKRGTVLLVAALIAAPACGGGGGGGAADPGGSPSPLSASFSASQPNPGPNSAAMALGPKSNDVVTVNVNLTGVSGAFGTAFEVTFDNTNLVYLGYAPGTVFEQGGDTPNYTVRVDPQSPNLIVAGISHTTQGQPSNVPGTATIVGLQFRVKQAGSYPLMIQNQVVYDGQSPPQPINGITWYAGAVSAS